jgi:hypothetical protein
MLGGARVCMHLPALAVAAALAPMAQKLAP